MHIAYAKGARTFERHIDVEDGGAPVARYSTLPAQLDAWFKAFHKAQAFCGASGQVRKQILNKETAYLDTYIRGVYAARDLPVGHQLEEEDIYLAIPLQKGQISTRELMLGKYGHKLTRAVTKDSPVSIDILDTPYSQDDMLKNIIYQRGL